MGVPVFFFFFFFFFPHPLMLALQDTLHYPAWRRRCKYLVSFVVSAAILGCAFAIMICSLNLQVTALWCCHHDL
jgi:hypothetical protein